METSTLKQNFMKIGYLRDLILKYFIQIEDGEISVSVANKATIDKISSKIEEFIKHVESINDIHEYEGIQFKMRDRQGNVVVRPFTSKELEHFYKVWQEDCSTFETKFEMFVYSYALEQKSASIARLYNTKSEVPITPEDVYKILELTALADMSQFILHHSFLKRLVYSTVPGVTVKRTLDSMLADYHPMSKSGVAEKQRLMRSLNLFESSSLGFYNPFDDSSDNGVDVVDVNAGRFDEDDDVTKPLQAKDIKSIRNWNQDVPAKVVYKNNGMYAGKYFSEGDIIERCPIKYMSEADLYSKNIRDNVFPIDQAKGIYAFPLGNALCYRNSDEAGRTGNITYEYDESSDCLVFSALRCIRKGDELILQVTSDDFANELKPNQFRYEQGPDVVYTTKNIKIM